MALIFVCIIYKKLQNKPTGKDMDQPRLDYLSGKVKTGSIAFLKEEYKYLSVYVAMWAVVLMIIFTGVKFQVDRTDGVRCTACFIAGATLSGAAGWFGMTVATDGNV